MKGKERERERISAKNSMKLALVFGLYDLNLSTTLLKLNIVLCQHLGFLKGMFREDLESLYVFFFCVYLYFWEVIIFVSD